MLRNASKNKYIKFSTARLHGSSEIAFNFLKSVSAILFESFFIAEYSMWTWHSVKLEKNILSVSFLFIVYKLYLINDAEIDVTYQYLD